MGSIGLITDSARQYGSARSLGYALGIRYWGQGYMTEAVRAVIRFGFEKMSLDVISATCYPDNLASRRVLEKCGFQYEGTLHRAEMLYNGRSRITCTFSSRTSALAWWAASGSGQTEQGR